MPELPEVEIIRLRIAPYIEGKVIAGVIVNTPKLRRPIPENMTDGLTGQSILKTDRRAKYLLLRCTAGTVIFHLGMTGNLRIVAAGTAAGKHDHLDLILENGIRLRFSDPRRFGSVLWTDSEPMEHPLLSKLGPEPLSDAFSGLHLFHRSRRRNIAVKQFIMDGTVVSGIGNIYANEALFRAGIHPKLKAGGISAESYDRLADAVRTVLLDAIEDGMSAESHPGETLETGYFPLRSRVYGRAGEPCRACGSIIEKIRLGTRSTFFCPDCQKIIPATGQ